MEERRVRQVAAQVLDQAADVLEAIEIRNKVVHEGYRVTSDNSSLARALMRETAKLLELEDFKASVLYGGNALLAPK
jgi:hypothetical protein